MLQLFRERLEDSLNRFDPIPVAPLQIDVHLTSALLQKALRRADGEFALRAALLLSVVDADRLWRRLTAIAFEDFGLSDLDLTSEVVAAASDAAWRRRIGGDAKVVQYLVQRLLRSARDRRIDELYMLTVSLSSAANPDKAVDGLRVSALLDRLVREATEVVLRCEQPDSFRGMRALLAKPCDLELGRRLEHGWIDTGLYATCFQGRRTSKCLLPVLLPTVKWAREQTPGRCKLVTRTVPPSPLVSGLPAYCADGYTQPGRLALVEVGRHDQGLRRVLSWLPSSKSRASCLRELLFVVEGGISTTELVDPLYEELKTHSVGCWSGLPKEALPEAFAAMRAAIPQLNWLRAQILKASP